MYAVSLALVLLAARILGSAGRRLVWTWWAPVAYLWHDAVVVLAFAAFEFVCRDRPRLVRAGYAVAAFYAIANVPVERALASPLTLAMWRAAGGPLADSIRHYATLGNAALVAAGVAVAALAPSAFRRLPLPPAFPALVPGPGVG